MRTKERFGHFIRHFSVHMPVAETELVYNSPYQLLVAVILSAQCTDKRVNMLTPAFFERFPDAESLASADDAEVFALIRSCSYPNNKTRNLIGMARMLINEFGGVVPSSVDELQKLPGVGRKTANVIASVVFDQPAMAVDTHVFRVADRIGLTTRAKHPLDAERQLVRHLPPDVIPKAHHWLILHGRYVCKARTPLCHQCGITHFCRWFEKQRQT
ncbi:MAG TPA: endonuclease III [Bacteroidales bacterium]|nr:endonuclease III [Bacteroidales bacterium]